MTVKRRVAVLVSVDTEEDQWEAERGPSSVENIRQISDLAAQFRSLGVRPTYFTSYQVAASEWAGEILRRATDGDAGEIGAHLHPWNTPPSDGPEPPQFTMLNNYPPDLVLARLRSVTTAVARVGGRPPESFRAGRFGLSPAVIWAASQLGYRVDSSVTPLLDWRRFGGGPEFIDAPWRPYPIGFDAPVIESDARGPMMEVPITVGFTGLPARWWKQVAHLIHRTRFRRTHLFGVLASVGLVRRVTVSPETNSAREMLDVCRTLLRAGTPHLHMFFHSSSLQPGLTPFGRTAADVRLIRDKITRVIEGIAELVEPDFLTVGEAGARLDPRRPGDSR